MSRGFAQFCRPSAAARAACNPEPQTKKKTITAITTTASAPVMISSRTRGARLNACFPWWSLVIAARAYRQSRVASSASPGRRESARRLRCRTRPRATTAPKTAPPTSATPKIANPKSRTVIPRRPRRGRSPRRCIRGLWPAPPACPQTGAACPLPPETGAPGYRRSAGLPRPAADPGPADGRGSWRGHKPGARAAEMTCTDITVLYIGLLCRSM